MGTLSGRTPGRRRFFSFLDVMSPLLNTPTSSTLVPVNSSGKVSSLLRPCNGNELIGFMWLLVTGTVMFMQCCFQGAE
jgi:hypothetical protein